MDSARWLDLSGTANARDVGGLPVDDGPGRAVRSGRLLRSDNLQELTVDDVRHLLVDLHLDTVIDLRTGAEVRGEGPGPLLSEPGVTTHHLSLFPEPPDGPADGSRPDGRTDTPGHPPARVSRDPQGQIEVLPWQDEAGERARVSASQMYLRFLTERPDSVVTALRLIATSSGATLVHCAAGKDRTGVVVAIALLAIGVPRAAVVADYVASAERIEAILARLSASATYAKDRKIDDVDHHRPRAKTIEAFLDGVEADLGGAAHWLRSQGWTDDDDAALRRALVEPAPPPRSRRVDQPIAR